MIPVEVRADVGAPLAANLAGELGETTLGGFSSYVELLTCLEMARDLASPNTNPENPPAKSGSRPKQPGQTDVTVGEAHRH
jgi:hypothetical protein